MAMLRRAAAEWSQFGRFSSGGRNAGSVVCRRGLALGASDRELADFRDNGFFVRKCVLCTLSALTGRPSSSLLSPAIVRSAHRLCIVRRATGDSLRSILSPDEVSLVQEALEQDKTLVENEIHLNDDQGGLTKLALWSNPGSGTLGNLTRTSRVVHAVESCLGGAVTHYHSKLLLKPPRQGGVWNWHQDYGYWYKDYFLAPDMLTAYFAVDCATLENGCMKVLPGSHHLGRLDHWTKGEQQGADLERVEQALQRFEETPVELESGDCLFFHCNLLHSSQGNFSDRRRMALASCYTLKTNVQYKDAYIPCFDFETIADDQLLRQGLVLSTAEDKAMLDPKLGVEKAIKEDQN